MRDNGNKTGGWSNAAVFWLLTGIGLLVVGACIILPVYEDHLRVRAEFVFVASQVADLQQRLQRQNLLIAAAETDPQYNEFIARNELNYGKPGQETIKVNAGRLRDSSQVDSPIQTAWQQVLPNIDSWWYRVFLGRPTRIIMLIMGGASLAVAILICNRPQKSATVAAMESDHQSVS